MGARRRVPLSWRFGARGQAALLPEHRRALDPGDLRRGERIVGYRGDGQRRAGRAAASRIILGNGRTRGRRLVVRTEQCAEPGRSDLLALEKPRTGERPREAWHGGSARTLHRQPDGFARARCLRRPGAESVTSILQQSPGSRVLIVAKFLIGSLNPTKLNYGG